MLVQFAGIIVEEPVIKTFPAKKEGETGSVVAEIVVAEVGPKDSKQFHKVQIWRKEDRQDLFQYLIKNKVVQVSGNFGYNVHKKSDDESHKYYAVQNATIELITDLPIKED